MLIFWSQSSLLLVPPSLQEISSHSRDDSNNVSRGNTGKLFSVFFKFFVWWECLKWFYYRRKWFWTFICSMCADCFWISQVGIYLRLIFLSGVSFTKFHLKWQPSSHSNIEKVCQSCNCLLHISQDTKNTFLRAVLRYRDRRRASVNSQFRHSQFSDWARHQSALMISPILLD